VISKSSDANRGTNTTFVLVRGSGSVDMAQEPFFLIVVCNRVNALVVDGQARGDGLFLIVLALGERSAVLVADIFNLGSVKE
jgi:hypothetical protein